MKQTGVEWLADKILKEHHSKIEWDKIVDQAKEMDKEQKIEFANNYGFDICGYDYEKAEQYYNTTFKSE